MPPPDPTPTPPELPEEARLLLEMTEEQWRLWQHHPVSRLFLRYLADYRARVEQSLLERWRAGGSMLAQEELEARGRVLACVDIEEMPLETLRTFYQARPPA